MTLSPRLDLRQSQQLVMTPQLQQAIKLLTLTNLELETAVRAEIDRNPLLESGDSERIESSDTPEPLAAGDVGVDKMLNVDPNNGVAEGALDIEPGEALFHHNSATDDLQINDRREEGLNLQHGAGSISGAQSFDDDTPGLEALLCANRSLHDYLREQAGQSFTDAEDYTIALHLIDLVDDAGYIFEPLHDVAQRLGISMARVERVLQVMHGFDPAGVCARSLSECLKIQAREADRLDPAMALMLDNLDAVARGDIPFLKRVCRVDQEDLVDMIREVRNYNPKPGLAFHEERSNSVVPDVFVRKTSAGTWGVELNTATLPRVLINQKYYAELSSSAHSRGDKQFLSEMLASANWLIKALDQRARTILKVASEIVRYQEAFFESGVQGLKPLTLKIIADSIGMHESTVSRVTTAKYISCTRGLFELKYFFTSSIASGDGGEALSSQCVKTRIRALIDNEETSGILSDDQIVDILRKENFDIARRTVAKYREALHIPSSVQRRRLKAFSSLS